MDEYRYQRLTSESLRDLIPLMEDAFGRRTSLTELRGRFDTRALGGWTLGFVAYHVATGEPAAYYGVFPCKIEFEGEVIAAAQSGDTMTHSRHRGKGLFVALARLTYDLAREQGIKLVFGFPNPNSYPGFIKHLGWTHHENLRRYALTVPALPLGRWMTKTQPSRLLYRAYSKAVLSVLGRRKAEGFPSSALEPGQGGIHRDDAYYAYKSRTGSFVLDVGGTRVWIKVDKAILIGDIERTDPAALEPILSALRRMGMGLGIRRIVFQTSPGTFWDRILATRFPVVEGLPIGWVKLGTAGDMPARLIRFTQGDMDIF